MSLVQMYMSCAWKIEIVIVAYACNIFSFW